MASACVSNPVELPSWDIPEATETVQYPLTLPEFPAGDRSETEVCYPTREFASVVEYLTVSGGNYDIAVANAEALQRQSAAYNQLIEAGKLQREVAQIRAELLEKERRDHTVDNLFHRGIIVLGLIAIALQ